VTPPQLAARLRAAAPRRDGGAGPPSTRHSQRVSRSECLVLARMRIDAVSENDFLVHFLVHFLDYRLQ
jgi:hypothetical protein